MEGNAPDQHWSAVLAVRGVVSSREGMERVDSFFQSGGMGLYPLLSTKLDVAAAETNRPKRFALAGQLRNLY